MPKYFRIKPNRVIVDGESVRYPWPVSSVLLEEVPPAPVVDPVLGNNDWATIRAVCEAGNAADYWSLGDTKTDLGEDGVTRTFRICDMQGLYGKHVVFEQVEVGDGAFGFSASGNDYSTSAIRTTRLPDFLSLYSTELQEQITNTTYKVAKGNGDSTILELTDKLFLPAEREIFGARASSFQSEWDALTRFALYALPENDNAAFRIKYDGDLARAYWERSPHAYDNASACRVSNSGSASGQNATGTSRIAPIFSF